MLAETVVEFGANLFVWIVAVLIGVVVALSFVDIKKKNANK